MARKMTEWPSKRGPITKIMPSDGCIGDTVPLAVGKWSLGGGKVVPWRWESGTISTNLDGIWGMSDYMPPSDFAHASDALLAALVDAFSNLEFLVVQGSIWTTDAPYRETEAAIAANQARGILAVEMEAAALYAFAQARKQPVVCIAHITNQMANDGDDFEKGEADGALASLAVMNAVANALLQSNDSKPGDR